MPLTVTATYEGGVLRPEGPLDLEPNVRYRITVEPIEGEGNVCEVIERLGDTIDAPADEHDRYLVGSEDPGSDVE